MWPLAVSRYNTARAASRYNTARAAIWHKAGAAFVSQHWVFGYNCIAI